MFTRHLATHLDALVFGGAYRSISSAIAAFGALALPSGCVVCGRWDTSLCVRCSAQFRRATARPFRAEEAAESLPDVEVGERRLHQPLPVVAAGRYGQGASAVMLSFKNHGHVDLAGPLAAALASTLHEALVGWRDRCRAADAGPARPGPLARNCTATPRVRPPDAPAHAARPRAGDDRPALHSPRGCATSFRW